MIAGIPIAIFGGVPEFRYVLLLMVPMVFDGFLQLLTPYESGNIRRLITGMVFGVAFIFFLIYFHRTCVWIAGSFLKLFVAEPERIDGLMKSIT